MQPFQIWSTLKWLTIPGTALLVRDSLILFTLCVLGFSSPQLVLSFYTSQSSIFFGFLVAGEEIESKYAINSAAMNPLLR